MHCGARLRARHNVPVASYVALRGACAACRGRISLLYPLLELGTAAAFALVGLRLGWSALLPAQLVFTWLLVVLAVIDARTRRIPNRITYPAAPVLVTLVLAAALLEGDPGIAVRSVLGGLAAGGSLLALALINPRGMGMGDVKLAVLIGLGLGALGWGHLLVGLFTRVPPRWGALAGAGRRPQPWAEGPAAVRAAPRRRLLRRPARRRLDLGGLPRARRPRLIPLSRLIRGRRRPYPGPHRRERADGRGPG